MKGFRKIVSFFGRINEFFLSAERGNTPISGTFNSNSDANATREPDSTNNSISEASNSYCQPRETENTNDFNGFDGGDFGGGGAGNSWDDNSGANSYSDTNNDSSGDGSK